MWQNQVASNKVGEPRRIYVSGPYTATTSQAIEINVRRAIDAGIEIGKRGHFPYIPHLTHFVELRQLELEAGFDYETYMRWDFEWIRACDDFLRLAHSPGADREYWYAKGLGLTIYESVKEIPYATKYPGDHRSDSPDGLRSGPVREPAGVRLADVRGGVGDSGDRPGVVSGPFTRLPGPTRDPWMQYAEEVSRQDAGGH